ncbi:MAG: dihydrolipoyl dehydrogenase [Clostridiales bacterium]|nr:dihydrolipoyl dehydrogenase [Clostridiales bacterium]
MAKEIIMPKNGMDMTEGVLIRWLVKVGDKVEKDDPIMEIETDKVTMESESPASGTVLALYYDEGATIPVLKVIGYIGAEGEQVPAAAPDAEVAGAGVAAPAADAGAVAPIAAVASGAVTEGLAASVPAVPGLPEAAPSGVAAAGLESVGFDYDVAVIGGGPAGYVAAIKAAQLGGRVVLFEKDVLGGTCLNRGCIPTKTYVKTAEYIENIKRASERGIVNDPRAMVDMAKVLAHKDAVVYKLTSGVAKLLASNGVTGVSGTAAARSAHEVECEGKVYTAGVLILCGGSKPAVPPIPGIDHRAVLSSDGVLGLDTLPGELVVLGGGVVGCEIACAFNAFGTKVTIVEMLPGLLDNMGRKVSEAIEKALVSSGVKVFTGTKVAAIEDAGGRPVVNCGDMRIEADIVLAATGREADLGCLGALAGQVATERGKIAVDDRMQTNVPGVYAAGDVTGGMMLAHTAFRMAETAAENALGGDARCNLKTVPSGVYTMPEAAAVGLDEDEALAKVGADRLSVGFFPLSANGRALASGEPEGFVQVMVDKEFFELLGVRIVGADAVEMIAGPAMLMAMEVAADEVVRGMVHAHPTYSEAFMEACADALGECVHLPKKK